MKNRWILVALLLVSFQVSAKEIDVGLVGGVTTNYFGTSTPYFTYGVTANAHRELWGVGLKFTNVSTTYLGATQGLMNLLVTPRYEKNGLFAGASIGAAIASVSTSPVDVAYFVYGPSVGYYLGEDFKYGAEVDYLMSTSSSSWNNLLVATVGVKYAL